LLSPPVAADEARTLLANWRPEIVAALGDRVTRA
jgi:hypothetical protein